jgi:4-amino-4-deoxy-L-arabinose transferase-like glycosyltransferase
VASVTVSSERLLNRSTLIWLAAIVGVGLVLRIIWAAWLQGTLHPEEIYYARIGENLAAGRGLVGMRENGYQLLYPPLFPILIGVFTWITGDGETAGRALSVILGAALAIPVMLLVRLFARPAVALTAAALFSVHPMIVGFDATVYSESTFFFFLYSGVFCACYWMLESKTWAAIAGGALFACAYLVRPEALAFPFFTAFFVLVFQARQGWPRWRGLLLHLGAFALFALPNIIFLWHVTGTFRLEAKTADNYTYGKIIASGQDPTPAYLLVDSDLTEKGIDFKSNLQVIKETEIDPKVRAQFLMGSAKTNIPQVLTNLGSMTALGSPFLLIACALGLLATPWSKRSLPVHGWMLFACFIAGLALATLMSFYPRYMMPVLLPMLVWAAIGVDRLAQVTETSASNLGVSPRLASFAGHASIAVLVLLSLGISAWGMRDMGEVLQFDGGEQARAGKTLREKGAARSVIMSSQAIIPFYAGAVHTPFPYATEESTVLKYIAAKAPDYVVIQQQFVKKMPYLESWLTKGLPDARATEVYRGRSPVVGEFIVYRWADPARKRVAASTDTDGAERSTSTM